MKIETKFNIGDNLNYLKNNKILDFHVEKICVIEEYNGFYVNVIEITYSDGDLTLKESSLFNSRKSLCKYLEEFGEIK